MAAVSNSGSEVETFQEVTDEIGQKFDTDIEFTDEAAEVLRNATEERIEAMMQYFEGQTVDVQQADEYLVSEEETGLAWSDTTPTETVAEIIDQKADDYGVTIDSYTKTEINRQFSSKAADIAHASVIVGEAEGETEVTPTLFEYVCELILDKSRKFPLFC